MTREGLGRRAPEAFLLTGALMSAATVLFGLLVLEWRVFPLFMLAVALGGLGGAVGLLALRQFLGRSAPRLVRVGAGVSLLAALGALVLVVLIPFGFVVVELLGRELAFVDPLFFVSMLVMLGGFLFALVVVGAGALRSALTPPLVGRLLVAGGLLFVVPLGNLLLGVTAPEAVVLVTFGVWAAIFAKIGVALRVQPQVSRS